MVKGVCWGIIACLQAEHSRLAHVRASDRAQPQCGYTQFSCHIRQFLSKFVSTLWGRAATEEKRGEIMDLWEMCRTKKENLNLTMQEIADSAGLPVGTVKKFFSAASKSPSVYTVAPICRVLGVSLDGYFGIGDHLTADEKTLQERADGLEHRLENKRQTIGLMETELRDLRHSVKLYRWIIFSLSLLIVGLIVWCIWGDIHCADYGIWRG